MAFNINNNDMEIYLDIKYNSNNKEPVKWCQVDYNFKFRDIINYNDKNDEVFENAEVIALERFLSDYLDGKLKDGDWIDFIEPDFSFYVDYDIKWEISLWGDGIGANSFSTSLEKEQVEKLHDYLKEVIGDKNDNYNS